MSYIPYDAALTANFVGPSPQDEMRTAQVRHVREHIDQAMKKGLEEALGPIDWNGLPEMLRHLSSEVIGGITVISYRGRQVLEVHPPEISYSHGPNSHSMNVTQRYRPLTLTQPFALAPPHFSPRFNLLA